MADACLLTVPPRGDGAGRCDAPASGSPHPSSPTLQGVMGGSLCRVCAGQSPALPGFCPRGGGSGLLEPRFTQQQAVCWLSA